MDELLTVETLAIRWRLSEKTVRSMMAAGKIPSAFKAGRQWRIRLDDLIDHENKQKVTPK